MSSGLQKKISMWQTKADEHREKQLINPFSDWDGASHRAKLNKTDEEYGIPVAGSKTQIRGKMAGALISSEILELCVIIQRLGTRNEYGNSCILFKNLFDAYTRISNKLVGMLIRARKQGLVMFEGEMLYQTRDDDVLITLVKIPEELASDSQE